MRRFPILSCGLVLLVVTALGIPGSTALVRARSIESTETPIADPIPDNPVPSDVGLTLERYLTIPSSSDTPPTARINYLGEVPDGSGRHFVPDLYGSLYLIEDGEPKKYLDLAEEFPAFISTPGLSTGFGFVCYHPAFGENGLFYTVHTEAGTEQTAGQPTLPSPLGAPVHGVIIEWKAEDPDSVLFRGTNREVLRIGFSSIFHGIQEINFNPTATSEDEDYGLLYVAVGDGEQALKWTNGPQDLGVPHGKLLRIDPQGTNSPNGTYGIPAANPFVGQPGTLGEIFAYGLRNPHRFSWDSAGDHRLFLGMIGEANIEAIYIVEPGDNFGWNEREGAFRFDKEDATNVYPLPEDDSRYGYTYPAAAYDHDTGNAIVGGFVYRGVSVPELFGKYVFGDILNGRIFYAHADEMRRGDEPTRIYEVHLFDTTGARTTLRALIGGGRVDLRFGIDAEGELYVLSKANGTIWRIGQANP